MRNAKKVVVLSLLLGVIGCGGGSDSLEEGVSSTQGNASNFNDLSNLSLAEITPVTFANGTARLDLDANSDSTFLFVVTSTDAQPQSFNLQLSAESAPALSLPPLALQQEEEESAEHQFHEFLREMEQVMAESDVFVPRSPSRLAALTQSPDPGSRQSFKVLSSMTSLAQYKTIEAELAAVSTNVYFYIDDNAAANVEQQDIQSLVDRFENVIRPRSQEFLGSESDINGDGHVTILMTCQPNQMSTTGGIVTGFFFPGDLYAASSANPASNGQEIFYVLCPDPEGKYGVPIQKEFALHILEGVLAHEYQHMISFNRHALLNAKATEEPWLNEALSHLWEDLTGHGNENPSRVKLFLSQPSATSLIPSTSPRLAERGAGYLFLRYLYEQHPDGKAFIQGLLNGELRGTANIVNAFGTATSDFDEFGEFLDRWAVTVLISGSGITTDPRYNYRDRVADPDTGNLTGICLRCEANDGRGTVLSGPQVTEVSQYPMTSGLSSSASQYFALQNVPEMVMVQSAGGPTLAGAILRLER